MNPIVSLSNGTHSIFIALSTIYSKYVPKQYLCFIIQQRIVQSESDQRRCFTVRWKGNRRFLKEGSEKLLAKQPDSVGAKYSRKYFIFIYVGYEINIAQLNQWILCVRHYFLLHPLTAELSEAKCVFEEATVSEQKKKTKNKTGALTKMHPDECLSLFLKLFEFIPILTNMNPAGKVIEGNSFKKHIVRQEGRLVFSKQITFHRCNGCLKNIRQNGFIAEWPPSPFTQQQNTQNGMR